jgi:hypothetical protein
LVLLLEKMYDDRRDVFLAQCILKHIMVMDELTPEHFDSSVIYKFISSFRPVYNMEMKQDSHNMALESY